MNQPAYPLPTTSLTVGRESLLKILVWTTFLLTLGHVLAAFMLHRGYDFAYGIVPLFYFDREGNFPTLFSSGMLALGGLIAFLLYRWRASTGTGERGPWAVMGAVLCFLAVDEGAGLHDQLDVILTPRLGLSGWLAWPWVLPYAALAILVMVVFLPFFLRLSMRYKIVFGLAATLYVVGALGLEMVGAVTAGEVGEQSLRYAFFVTIEELLEMSAVILVIHGIMDYIVRECEGFEIRLGVHR